MQKFKVGDKVRVIDSDCSYTTYDRMADMLKATNWDRGTSCRNGEKGIILNFRKHENSNATVALVNFGGNQRMIGIKGLELVSSAKETMKVKVGGLYEIKNPENCGVFEDAGKYVRITEVDGDDLEYEVLDENKKRIDSCDCFEPDDLGELVNEVERYVLNYTDDDMDECSEEFDSEEEVLEFIEENESDIDFDETVEVLVVTKVLDVKKAKKFTLVEA